jgi:hypothetical protein
MAEPKTFYGGEPLMGAAGGEIGAGKYDGPEAHVQAPWKCPACGLENLGPLPHGCVHCGSGKPGRHVGVETPPPPVEAGQWIPPAVTPETPTVVEQAFVDWIRQQEMPALRATENERILFIAFFAGWTMQQQRTMTSAPVTADVRELAPHTKAQRTIIAALELFRDQVLGSAEEEIASGEWCTLQEVAELIERLRAQL